MARRTIMDEAENLTREDLRMITTNPGAGATTASITVQSLRESIAAMTAAAGHAVRPRPDRLIGILRRGSVLDIILAMPQVLDGDEEGIRFLQELAKEWDEVFRVPAEVFTTPRDKTFSELGYRS